MGLMGIGIALTGCAGDPPADGAPLTQVPASRVARLATGANICRWFRYPDPATDPHFNGYIGAEEMKMMRQMGLRHVRLCVAPAVFLDDSDKILPARLAQVDAAIRKFQAADLAVVLDIHNEDRTRLETAGPKREAFKAMWAQLARHYAGWDPEMLILEIVNEPVFDNKESEWFALQKELVQIIREAAPRHTIMASGPNWGGIWGLGKLEPLEDKNIIYSFHCYDPFAFTHQSATWSSNNVKPLKKVPYPSSPELVAPLMEGLPADAQALLKTYGEERWDRARMAKNFAQAIDWGKKHQAALYCGEFGVYPVAAEPEARARWFRDFGSVLKENGVGWAVWGWDEGFGLNRKKVDGKPVVDAVVAEALGLRP
jgi:aryl-phospho-beta-D-glucosidase BglC (GH1 family)